MRFPSDAIYVPASASGRLACSHGHIYSLFNAPDFTESPQDGLPLGHFVTRLAALHALTVLRPGQTVADLPSSGDPTATALLPDAVRGVIQSFVSHDLSLSHLIIQTLLDAVGATSALPITLADGQQITAAAVADRFARVFERWKDPQAFPLARFGRDPGLLVSDQQATITIRCATREGGQARVVDAPLWPAKSITRTTPPQLPDHPHPISLLSTMG